MLALARPGGQAPMLARTSAVQAHRAHMHLWHQEAWRVHHESATRSDKCAQTIGRSPSLHETLYMRGVD